MSDRLSEIAAREAAATPGPWESCGMDDADWIKPDHEYALTIWAPDPRPGIIRHAITCDTFQESDADFIAHARSDIPFLLSTVRALRAELEHAAETHQANVSVMQRMDAENERLLSEYKDLVEHHRQCELAGTRLADLARRQCEGTGDPVDDNVLLDACDAWDEHQWPASVLENDDELPGMWSHSDFTGGETNA